MFKFLQRRLKSEKGAMDSIMVTLLLVVIGVGAIVGIATWLGDKQDSVKDSADTKLESVLDEADAQAGEGE